MLEIANLNFSYGGVKALTQVQMSIPKAQMTCIMGRNGVGKTTLIRNIIGLLQSSDGSIKLDGQEIINIAANKRARCGIGLVPQGRMIFPKLTVEENLKIGLRARRDGVKVVPAEIYDTFPILKEFRGRRGGDLSGGQQQQLAIGRAMAGDPRVMLLDEPTEGIQPNVIQQIGHVLRQLIKQTNLTVVLVEQYVDFVREFGDKVYIMNRGQVVAETAADGLTQAVVAEHLSV